MFDFLLKKKKDRVYYLSKLSLSKKEESDKELVLTRASKSFNILENQFVVTAICKTEMRMNKSILSH